MIKVEGLRKRFGNQQVLDDVNLTIQTGEAAIVVGRSGEGKSVLLKHLTGLIQPDAGEVWIDDVEISHRPERELLKIRQNMAVMFQGAALFDSMNVEENVGFLLRREGKKTEKEIKMAVAETLDLVNLNGMQKKWPSDLSGGMKKRVGLARAIIHNPSIVFYDEPTAGLDPVTSDSIDKLIKRICEVKQVTTVVITHDMRTVEIVGQKVYMLYQGKIYLEATPVEVFASKDPLIYNFVNGISKE